MAENKKKEESWWAKGLNTVDNVLSAPARATTWAITGKYQDPSEALGIDAKKHPYLKIATDLALDPTNLLGIGLVSKAGKILKGAKTLEDAKTIIKTKRVFEAEKYLAAQQKANELGKTAAGMLKEPGVFETFGKAAKPYHKAYIESFDAAWKATNGFTKVVKDSNKAAKALPIAIINDLIKQYPDKADVIRQTFTVLPETNKNEKSINTKNTTTKSINTTKQKEIFTNKSNNINNVDLNKNNNVKLATAINIQSQEWNDITDISSENINTNTKDKGKPLNDFLIQTVKTPNGIKTYKRKDRNSEWIEEQKYGGKIKKLGFGGISSDGKSNMSSGGGMNAGSIVGMVGNSLDTLGNFIPVDNDGHGVSKRGQAISGGIQTGLDSAADIANSIPGGQIVGGALKIGSFLTKGITAIVNAVEEKKHPTDELVNEKYSPTYKDSSFSFGQMALGGNVATDSQKQFKQYDAPSHRDDGQMIDKNNNPTHNENKAVAEIEKKENSYKNYVFSHELGFAKLAEKINKKYKDREDPISKNSLDIELTELMKKNEKVKQQIQQSQQLAQTILEYGGVLQRNDTQITNTRERDSVTSYNQDISRFNWNNTKANAPIEQVSNEIATTPLDKNYLLNKTPNGYFNVYDKGNKMIGYSMDGKTLIKGEPKMKMGGKIPKASLGVLLSDKNKLPYEEGYVNQLISQAGINPNIPPIKALNDLNINSYKSQGADGIDIEAPNDNYGKGIAVNSPEYLNQMKKDSEFYKSGQVGTAKEEDTKKQFSPEAIAGFGIKGIEMLGHAIQAFKKPDYVKPVYNPEENKIKSLMSNRKIDMQSILNELDLEEASAKQNISDNSSSVGVKMANLQKLNANNVNAVAKTKIQEQQANNQYRADEAQVLNNLGQQKTQAQVYAEDVNARSKGNVQNQRDKFLKESIGGLGDFLLKKDYVNKENQFQENILKSKGINFGPTSYKTWNKAGINIVEFAGELESETDTAKRNALKAENKTKYLAAGGTEASWNAEIHELENKYLKK